ncbi:hypothetical protein GO013_02450 [Pseudodesulfovibrio sp. JC047]|uniref:hypothetical protein n=1 Tax=Pseudodesulfovibrio sp. JC047 TaxID=2683199 RepID=UPI0013D400D2|nr:hypothetical protein [Pseudodesulfovibrio sp. JC047]NDV18276.1 hypothetical protein [Pseudodesulfovibrio sp. JC047]
MSNAKLILEDGSEYLIDAESLHVKKEFERGELSSLSDEELPNMDVAFSLAKEETVTADTLPIAGNTTIEIRTDAEPLIIEKARICGPNEEERLQDGNKKIEITGYSQK